MGPHPWPDLGQEDVPLLHAESLDRPLGDKHADTAPDPDIAVILKRLICLGDGQWVGAMIGREGTDRGQLIPFRIISFQDRRREKAPQTDIDGDIGRIIWCHVRIIHQNLRVVSPQSLPANG